MKAWGLAMLAASGLWAQAPVKVEIASVRVHKPDTPDRAGPPISGNRLIAGGNFKQLLINAYGLKNFEIYGGPSWVTDPSLDRDYFDITAQAEGTETLTPDRARLLLQAVLVERFQLKAHREKKEMAVYNLVVAKGGQKFKETTSDSKCVMQASISGVTLSTMTVASTFTNCQMDLLIRMLNSVSGRPVVDRTGLTGSYDFKVEFARDPAAAADVTNAASLFTALPEQLGLKLDPQKAPVEVLVIDSVERPSDN